MLGDRLDPDDRSVRQPRPVPGPDELLRCLGYRLGPAAGLHDQRDTITFRPDAGGDPIARRHRVGKLDHLLAGQHPVSLRLDPHAPLHPALPPCIASLAGASHGRAGGARLAPWEAGPRRRDTAAAHVRSKALLAGWAATRSYRLGSSS